MSQLKQYTVNSIRSFDDLKYVASLFAQAQTFGKDSPQVLAVKIMAGLAFNLDPFSAATSLHVIQGKVVGRIASTINYTTPKIGLCSKRDN
jgi:hypothetical protein